MIFMSYYSFEQLEILVTDNRRLKKLIKTVIKYFWSNFTGFASITHINKPPRLY